MIVVAFALAPAPADAVGLPDGTVDVSRAPASLSADDLPAVALGRSLADAAGVELVGVCVGGPDAAAPAGRKAALAHGLDRLVVVSDAALADAETSHVAAVLAEVVRGLGSVEALLTGEASLDHGTGLLPGLVAGLLGWPVVPGLHAARRLPGGWELERLAAGAQQVLRVATPAVLVVAPHAPAPTNPGLTALMAAARKPVTGVPTASLGVLAPPVRVVGRRRPDLRPRDRVVIDTPDAAAAAAQLLALEVLR